MEALLTADKRGANANLYKLLCDQCNQPTKLCPYRGFSIINRSENRPSLKEIVVSLTRSVCRATNGRHVQKIEGRIDGERRPVWFVYSGMGSQWAGMARDMMRIACFRDSIISCTAAVSAYECDPYALIMHGDEDVWTNTMNCIVCITAVQVQS
jgi:fatty acid synthase